MTINQVCGSGLRAVALAAQSVQLGDADIVVAGGHENMSLAPHAANLRNGVKMGPSNFADTMIVGWSVGRFQRLSHGADGGESRGKISDQPRRPGRVSRSPARTRRKPPRKPASSKTKSRRSSSRPARAKLSSTTTNIFAKARRSEGVSGLRPAFKRDGGTVTAANASGFNDGAAALVVMSEKEAEKRGLEPLARIASASHCGVDPSIMGIGPAPASRIALEKAGWSLDDLDLIEANEAFAAQALAVGKELGWDPEKVNVNGGAIALGHPIGASGARILTTLLHEMQRSGKSKGLATLCIGGGMGVAMCVER